MKTYNIHNINLTNIDIFINQLTDLENQCFILPWSKQSFYESFYSSNYKCYAAVNNDETILGYVGWYEILHQIFITNIAVFKKFRNHGVAFDLLTKLIEHASSTSAEFISLEVRCSNFPAINLYNKFKFKKVGIRKNFYQSPIEDALILTLTFK